MNTRQLDPTQQNQPGVARSISRRVLIDAAQPLHQKVGKAWEALAAANDPVAPRVMVRGNALVRMTERGALEPIDPDSMRHELSQVAQFTRSNDNGVLRDVDPPMDVAKTLLALDSAKYVDGPRVDRVVDVPVLTQEGRLTQPGLNPGGLYYRPAPSLDGLRIPTADDVADVASVVRARDLLLTELFGDFDFVGPADRTHALGLLMLPFVREFIGDHPTPLHVALAPDHGTGKTTLMRAALVPGCGLVPATPGGENDAEWRKGITALLLAGSPAVLLDNLSGTLDSPALASALTTGTWSDRLLGASQTVELPVRNAWAATGNNLDFASEQVRRVVPIFLKAPAGRAVAHERSAQEFRHPDLLGWAVSQRQRLVEAALVLVRHWAEGEAFADESGTFSRMPGFGPRAGTANLGSFTRWAQAVGGTLEAAGVEDFLTNRGQWTTAASEAAMEAADFLRAWHDADHEPLTAHELLDRCVSPGDPLRENLPTEMAAVRSREGLLQKKLTVWLKENNGKRNGDFQLLGAQLGGAGNRRRWSVRRSPGAA